MFLAVVLCVVFPFSIFVVFGFIILSMGCFLLTAHRSFKIGGISRDVMSGWTRKRGEIIEHLYLH
jgi:hypothetical protein